MPSTTSTSLATTTTVMEQSLGGTIYRIDPSKIDTRNPLWKKAIKVSIVIVASPVIVPTAIL